MLFGSVGVTVNRHFCMGELKSLTLFGESQVCAMAELEAPPCPMHDTLARKKGCCDDKHEFVKWDDNRQASQLAPLPLLHWAQPLQPVPAFPEYALHLRARRNSRFENYRPPPLLIDVLVRWQVFRL